MGRTEVSNVELPATVDWLLHKEGVEQNMASLQQGLRFWPGGAGAAARKLQLFDERLLALALERVLPFQAN
jgi:hypothetical protein